MYFATKLNLEPIPVKFVNYILNNFDKLELVNNNVYETSVKKKLPKFVLKWLTDNIADIPWQVIKFIGNYPFIHKDYSTTTSLWFLIQKGNAGVKTLFYDPEGKEALESNVLKERQWYLFRNDIYHNQEDLEPTSERILIIGIAHAHHSVYRESTKLVVE